MNRYEGMLILDIAGKEDHIAELIDGVSRHLTDAGASVGTVESMEKKQFARVTDKHLTSGFYVSLDFTAPPDRLFDIRKSLRAMDDVYRVFLTRTGQAAA